MPDICMDGRPDLATLDAAFCQAFALPSPGMFDATDPQAAWINAMSRQTVAVCHRLERATFATKLDLHLWAQQDVLPPLLRLAALLDCPLALDLGLDTADDTALLLTPDGRQVPGLLIATGPCLADDHPEVAFRPR
ncbi:hypothetical protein ACLBXM_15980 [Xanthobacteraceae bacterium A53D]